MRSILIIFATIVLLACGMALVWGFLQYKNQATASVARQADIGLAWLRSEVQGEVLSAPTAPTPDGVRDALRAIAAHAPEASAVLYYVAPDDGEPLAVGGGPMGAPRPPWYVRYQLQRGTQELIDPVRHITNRSSGKMGYAIAEAALARGARVTLISAPVALLPPPRLDEADQNQTDRTVRFAVQPQAAVEGTIR